MKIHPLEIKFDYNGQQQCIYPILLQDEHDTILVDCGYPHFVPLLEEAIGEHGVSFGDITKLIVTHHDIDHIGPLAEIKRKHPHICIIAHELEAPYIEGVKRSLRLAQAEETLQSMPDEHRLSAEQFITYLRALEPAPVDRTVTSLERLTWLGGMEIVPTPGHMPGHISLYLEQSRTLIAGDAVVVEEGALEIANPQYTLDLEEAVRSVERLLAYDIDQLVCYHGGIYREDVRHALEQLLRKYSSR
jgi:glyoxylase-like metal-dependent hydrolase (beta-lactamase superfamily II)